MATLFLCLRYRQSGSVLPKRPHCGLRQLPRSLLPFIPCLPACPNDAPSYNILHATVRRCWAFRLVSCIPKTSQTALFHLVDSPQTATTTMGPRDPHDKETRKNTKANAKQGQLRPHERDEFSRTVSENRDFRLAGRRSLWPKTKDTWASLVGVIDQRTLRARC